MSLSTTHSIAQTHALCKSTYIVLNTAVPGLYGRSDVSDGHKKSGHTKLNVRRFNGITQIHLVNNNFRVSYTVSLGLYHLCVFHNTRDKRNATNNPGRHCVWTSSDYNEKQCLSFGDNHNTS